MFSFLGAVPPTDPAAFLLGAGRVNVTEDGTAAPLADAGTQRVGRCGTLFSGWEVGKSLSLSLWHPKSVAFCCACTDMNV